MKRIRINIGKLTLPGYSAAGQKQFTDALKAQLSELGKTRPTSNINIRGLDAGDLRPGVAPQDAGTQIGKTIRTKLKGSRHV